MHDSARTWHGKTALLPSILAKVFRPKPQAISGHVDHVDGAVIRGWAWDARAPSLRVHLDVFCRGVFLGCARTGAFRQDLFDRTMGDGCLGFVFHIPAIMKDDVRAADIDIRASKAPSVRLAMTSADGRRCRDASHRDMSDPPLTARSFFLPLVRVLERRGPAAPMPATRHRHIDLMFRSRPNKQASAFANHIARKYGRALAAADPEAFWSWYLESYSVEKGAARAPLSANDIAILQRLKLCRSQSRSHAWAVHESRRLFIEDCLVPSALQAKLRRVALPSGWTPFPLSRFMRMFRADHWLLRDLATRTEQDRVLIYAIMMLFALHDVHYLIYLPRRWLAKMLEATPRGIRFERAQMALFGPSAPCVAKETFVRHVGTQGFDMATQSFAGHIHRGHRVRGGGTQATGPTVDVQLIGPFRRKLGLAESCRRLAIALRGSMPSVNFVDYDIGCSAVSAGPEVALGAIRDARITILHLNAEEVPEAVASLPDTVTRSHTILVPYWELNRLSCVHRLGLDLVDEVWATTRFLASVFSGAKPVTHIGMSFDDRPNVSRGAGRAALSRLGIPSQCFTILTISDALSWTQRKNVLAAIDAFQAAFDDQEVALVIKTRNVDGPLSASQAKNWAEIVSRCARDPRVRIVDADLSTFDQKALLAGADGLLSLHRAEGLGFDILDALYRGTPVIATAYSGNMDFCNEETCWLVDYDPRPVAPDDYAFVEPGHVWAEPKLGTAITALRALRHDRACREGRAAAGQAHVRASASPQRLGARVSSLLAERLRGA